jgi:hypothetical protein
VTRLRLAKAESQLKSAKEQARLAKRRRKEAKQVARRAKKQARLARNEFAEAKQALAEAEAKLASAGVRVATRKSVKARVKKRAKPIAAAPKRKVSLASKTEAPTAPFPAPGEVTGAPADSIAVTL